MPAQAQDKWEQFAEPAGGAGGGDKWEQFAEKSTIPGDVPGRQTISPPPQPGVLGRPAMPGTSSRFAGPQSVALTPENRASRSIPFDVAKVAAPSIVTAVAPEAMLPGAVAQVVGRGAGALGGASYGGKLASDAGLPKWAGQVVGGATGLLAPEVIGKMTGPLLSRIATLLGKSAPEVATVIAEDSTLAQRVGRDVVERAARGAPLTPKEEELLFDQVQKHYTPEAGVESSAQKAGKVYAGRGTSLRPTNEQISLSRAGGGTGAIPPPPSPEVTLTTDSLGVRWAHSPESPNPVSIPKSIPEGEVQEYAAGKLREQAEMAKGVKSRVPGASGESSASAEAINRTAAESRAGVKYFIEDARSGQRVPVSSVDANGSMRLGPGKRIIRVDARGESIYR